MGERNALADRYLSLLDTHQINLLYLNDALKDLSLDSSQTSLFLPDTLAVKRSSSIIPSVSSVIRMAQPIDSPLTEWKVKQIAELGFEGYVDKMKQTTGYSSQFHKYIEERLEGKRQADIFDDKLKRLEPIFDNVNRLVFAEKNIVHNTLIYKGRLDCLAYYKNDLCLIDWKLSDKRKTSLTELYDQPVQLAAYWSALLNDPSLAGELKEHKIKYAMIVNVHKSTGEVDFHQFDIDKIKPYWNEWLVYLTRFWRYTLSRKKEKLY